MATHFYPQPCDFSPLPHYLRYSLIVFLHLYLRRPSKLFLAGIAHQNFTCISLPTIRATCFAHFILLDIDTLIQFGED